MEIITTWHGDQFNVELASREGAEAFISIKGARIVEGSKGAFVSWPATKNQNTGKWWNHVWASEKFSAAVLAKAQATMPGKTPKRQAQEDDGGDIPF